MTNLMLLPKLAYMADAITRQDMIEALIHDERTYVASLIARMRDFWRLAGGSSVSSAYVPNALFEQKNGMDAVVIIRLEKSYKCLGFEAKRPMFSGNYDWDKLASSTAKSRFSRQLQAQNVIRNSGWATGAFFIDERNSGSISPTLDPLGGVFLDQKHLLPTATAILTATPGGSSNKWNTSMLLPFLTSGVHDNLEDVILALVTCNIGWPLTRSEVIASTDQYFNERMRERSEPSALGDARDFHTQNELSLLDDDGSDTFLVRYVLARSGAAAVSMFNSDNSVQNAPVLAGWRKAKALRQVD